MAFTPEAVPMMDDRERLSLFMPGVYRGQIRAAASRLDVADSAILVGAWITARDALATSSVRPALAAGPSELVYFYVPTRIQDEVAAAAEAIERSRSWVLLKAWHMARYEIEGIATREAFDAWVRRHREGSTSP